MQPSPSLTPISPAALTHQPKWFKGLTAKIFGKPAKPDAVELPSDDIIDALRGIHNCGIISQAVSFPRPDKAPVSCVITGSHDSFVLPADLFAKLREGGWVTESAYFTELGRAVLTEAAFD
ncbi:hypothetical protein [Litorimonas sp. WD9-15]|uniref:hypothetical protein n=1 Tax=Litorimonas sp. WD9-15 TaxID=3418716 RepID=UPI003D06368E